MRGLAVLMTAAMIAVGCGSDDSSDANAPEVAPGADTPAYQAAKEEGELVWYSGQDPERTERTADAFERKYPGIEVETLRLAGSKLTQRYQADADAGNFADVLSTAVPAYFEQAAQDGLFAKLTPKDVPSFADYPAEAKRFGDTTVAIGTSILITVYNTDLVPESEVPKTIEDLLKPEFKDQIILPDPRIIPTFVETLQAWDDELGDQFLKDFAAQDLTIVDSGVPGVQSVAAGEKKILIPTERAVIEPLIEQGAPVDSTAIYPINGTKMQMAMSEKAPSPNAARLFMDFVLSEEGQRIVNAPDKISPLGVDGTVQQPAGYIDVDVDEAARNRDRLLALVGLTE